MKDQFCDWWSETKSLVPSLKTGPQLNMWGSLPVFWFVFAKISFLCRMSMKVTSDLNFYQIYAFSHVS